MSIKIILQCFFINLAYIMINTIRTILTMKGYKKIAPFLAVIEVIIYTLGLSIVISKINENIGYLIFYALGFGVGIYLGILVEEKLAIGYTLVEIVTEGNNYDLVNLLRDMGFGVTIENGYGKDGERLILTILTPRSSELDLRRTLEEECPDSFYVSYDVRFIHGGFWTKKVRRMMEKKHIADEK